MSFPCSRMLQGANLIFVFCLLIGTVTYCRASLPSYSNNEDVLFGSKPLTPDDIDSESAETMTETKISPPLIGDSTKEHRQYKKRPLTAILEPSTICGRVPIYEKASGRSINEAFQFKTKDGRDEQDDDDGNFRILYGLDAIPGEWPWIVRISFCRDDQGITNCGFCTGSLLNKRWIITAGHCYKGRTAKYRGQLGLYNLLLKDRSVINVSFDRFIQHPKYNRLKNDLTLMRLRKPIKYSEFIQPVCILDLSHEEAIKYSRERKCYNVGYGVGAYEKSVLNLQKLEVEAKDPRECKRNPYNHLTDKDVCIGPSSGIGASCHGDSGGPDNCFDPNTNQWFVLSTVSHGPPDCDREDDSDWMTVSTGIASYRKWIENTIRANTD